MIAFTDDQIRTISKEIITLPAKIASALASATDQETQKVLAGEKDDGNKVFFDHYLEIIDSYHQELRWIDGNDRALYDDANIIPAAQRAPGNVHYPTSPFWTNFQPKLVASNNGNPVTAQPSYELLHLPIITAQIDLLLNGYTDGALDDISTTAAAAGIVEVTTGGFSDDEWIVVDNAGISLLGVITDTTGTPTMGGAQVLAYTVLAAAAGALGVGSRVRNFHPGFSNAEREGTSGPYAPEVMAYFKTLVDNAVADWIPFLTPQKTALEANDATGAEATQNTTALASVDDALDAIDTWQNSPATGAGVGRYGNTVLAPLQAVIATRTTDLPTRATEISTSLGSVSQGGDGSYSGTGNYNLLFDWINQRVSFCEGSLFKYYNYDLGKRFLTENATNMQNKLDEYLAVMLVKKLTADYVSGLNVTLENTTGLSIGNEVKFLTDNDVDGVINAEITAVAVSIVGIDTPLTAAFTVAAVARLVKLL